MNKTYKPFDRIGDCILVPINPPEGLLMSMAIRYDHGLGWPGYYDQYPKWEGCTHSRMVESTLTTMSQLYEEVVGKGFYSVDRDTEYATRASIMINNGKGDSNENEIKSNSEGFEDSEVSNSGC